MNPTAARIVCWVAATIGVSSDDLPKLHHITATSAAVSRYDVLYVTPSVEPWEAMPVGGGDLRVGIVTREYRRSMVRHERSALRRSATAAAAVMLGSVVASQAARVTGAIFKASGRSVGGAISGLGSRVKEAGASLASRLPFSQGESSETDGGE